MHVMENQHLEKMFSKLESFRQSNKFCDVVLKVPSSDGCTNVTYLAHKVILAANSVYFKSMFNIGFSISTDNSVSLIGVTNDEFQYILNYMYTGRLCVAPNMQSLFLKTADFLQIDLITKIFIKKMKKHQFNLEESLNNLDFILMTFQMQLGNEFALPVLRNFSYCLSEKKHYDLLLKLDFTTIRHLLDSNCNEAKENELFSFLLEWIMENSPSDKRIEELLKCIRTENLEKDQFEESLKKYSEIAKREPISKWIAEIKFDKKNASLFVRDSAYYYFVFICDNTRFYYDILKNCIVTNKSSIDSDSVLASLEDKLSKIEKDCYFSSLDLVDGNLSGLMHYKKEVTKLPVYQRYENQIWLEHYKCALSIESYLKVGHSIIHVGGWDESRHMYLKGCAIYGDGPWKKKSSMKNRRGNHGLAIESGIVYALGGKNDNEALNSVECLCINSNQEWKTLAPIPISLHSFGCTSFDGKIYVIGGIDSNGKMSEKCFAYDIKTDKWESISSLPKSYKILNVIFCYGMIYCLGTNSENHIVILSYDLKTDKWSKLLGEDVNLGNISKATCLTRFSKADVFQI